MYDTYAARRAHPKLIPPSCPTAEFWFSIIKIVTILGLILLGIIITSGGVPGSDPIGFRFWHNPGPFQQLNGIPGATGRFLSFWSVFVQAAFSYLGTEVRQNKIRGPTQPRSALTFRNILQIVALTAGEAAVSTWFKATPGRFPTLSQWREICGLGRLTIADCPLRCRRRARTCPERLGGYSGVSFSSTSSEFL